MNDLDLDEVIDRARVRIAELEATNDELLATVRGYQVETDKLSRLAERSTEQVQQLITMNEQLLALNAALQSELEQALGDSPRNVH